MQNGRPHLETWEWDGHLPQGENNKKIDLSPPLILCLILLTIEPVHGRLLSPQGVWVAAPADVRNAPEFIPRGCVEASI